MRIHTILPAMAVLAACVWPCAAQIVIRKSGSIDVFVEPTAADSGKVSSELEKLLGDSGTVKSVADRANAYVVRAALNRSSLSGTVHDPSGRRLLNEKYPWPGDGGSVRRFASDIVIAITGHPAVPTGTIVFSGLAGKDREIFACAPDGSNLRQLTHDKNIAESPAISPDGSKIAFTTGQPGHLAMDRINLATGKREHLFTSPETNAGIVFSPDGRLVALVREFSGNPELCTGSPGGRLRRISTSPGEESSPSWSPDGRRLAFAYREGGHAQVFLTGAGGGEPTPVRSGFEPTEDPDWSPDGTKLALAVRAGGQPSVAVHDLGSGKASVVGPGSEPVWAPDSRHLACVDGGSLVLIDTDTGRKSVLVAGRGARHPSWTR